MKRALMVMIGMVALAWSCGSPECIYCNNIEGYPQGEICRDTYETTLLPGTPSWADYSEEALQDSCTKQP